MKNFFYQTINFSFKIHPTTESQNFTDYFIFLSFAEEQQWWLI